MKHRKVQNLLNVLQRASIPMPRGTMGFALKAGAKPVNVKSRVQTVKTHCKVRWQSWAPKELKATTFSSFVTKAMTKVLEDKDHMRMLLETVTGKRDVYGRVRPRELSKPPPRKTPLKRMGKLGTDDAPKSGLASMILRAGGKGKGKGKKKEKDNKGETLA